ncbi:Ribonuclease P protein component [Buchnera aphidicola (Cinara cuneomaculata)]|uniref:Ribonuclease P protein component n=1 Tax=Buchnera aphidicola (Cinara cuneomaculata) TaxID=1660040 RepID=A0A451CXX3_9GAMM|nr:ribonuclease P protein component [Buchnera aphidicola]VFP77991.1 Ribonuclease P protein component [Buchnera aphidicola (Cinara cuneomaculata)]
MKLCNTPRFFFKKKLRLLSNDQFKYVYERNFRIHVKSFIILRCINNLNYPRLGMSIAKKNIIRSHDRNRIKRLIRESFRLIQHNLLLMDFIIIVKKNTHLLKNNSILFFLQNIWRFNSKKNFKYK